MTTYGLTAAGFVVKPFEDIKASLEDAFRGAYGAHTDVQPEGPIGQFIGVFSGELAPVWEVIRAVHAARDPDAAEGTALDGLMALTGTQRLPARPSTVTLTLTGTPATSLATGRVASVAVVGTRFETVNGPHVIAALPAWAGATAYSAGDRVTNASRAYEALVGGTSAGSGGPTSTAASIPDGAGALVWRYLGEGTGAVDAEAEAQETGPLAANAGTVTVIETPAAGWSSVTNLLDAELGADLEVDPAARLRREVELRATGNASVEAIRAKILRTLAQGGAGAVSCHVFENETDVTDGDGRPPHSVQAVVQGGEDQDIAEVIFATKAAGIRSYGSTSVVVVDSTGTNRTVQFSRPTLKPVWITVALQKDPARWPADGEAQVEAALVAFGDALPMGYDVVADQLRAAIFSVSGVWKVTSLLIGFADPPVAGADLTVATLERATFDTGRISVVASDWSGP